MSVLLTIKVVPRHKWCEEVTQPLNLGCWVCCLPGYLGAFVVCTRPTIGALLAVAVQLAMAPTFVPRPGLLRPRLGERLRPMPAVLLGAQPPQRRPASTVPQPAANTSHWVAYSCVQLAPHLLHFLIGSQCIFPLRRQGGLCR